MDLPGINHRLEDAVAGLATGMKGLARDIPRAGHVHQLRPEGRLVLPRPERLALGAEQQQRDLAAPRLAVTMSGVFPAASTTWPSSSLPLASSISEASKLKSSGKSLKGLLAASSAEDGGLAERAREAAVCPCAAIVGIGRERELAPPGSLVRQVALRSQAWNSGCCARGCISLGWNGRTLCEPAAWR